MQNILDFEKDYPEAKVVSLEENYRSTKKIFQAANEVIKNNCNFAVLRNLDLKMMTNKLFITVLMTKMFLLGHYEVARKTN